MENNHYKNFQSIKEQFPEALLRNKGFISTTCKRLGIHRNTYYVWYKEDPAFAAACDEAIELMGDWVESKLFENIENNDTTAIKFCLSTKFKNRGYAEKETNVINVNNAYQEDDLQMLEDHIERIIQERLKDKFSQLAKIDE